MTSRYKGGRALSAVRIRAAVSFFSRLSSACMTRLGTSGIALHDIRFCFRIQSIQVLRVMVMTHVENFQIGLYRSSWVMTFNNASWARSFASSASTNRHAVLWARPAYSVAIQLIDSRFPLRANWMWAWVSFERSETRFSSVGLLSWRVDQSDGCHTVFIQKNLISWIVFRVIDWIRGHGAAWGIQIKLG